MGRMSPPVPMGIYYLHNRINEKTGKRQIYIRYYCRGCNVRRAMGIHVLEANWDQAGQKIYGTDRETVNYNRFLRTFKNKVDAELLEYKDEITPPVVERALKGKTVNRNNNGSKQNLIEYCYEYNKTRYTTGYTTFKTYQNKLSSIKVFERYLKMNGRQNMTVSEIDLATIDDFIEYRRTILNNTSPEGINKALVPIYKALEYASNNGLIERQDIFNIIDHFVPTKKTAYADRKEEKLKYLTTDQINRLIRFHETCRRERTKEFLEIWLFSYFACGMRISDIITLEWGNIDVDAKTITKNQYKTGADVSFPLNENALLIIKKWQKSNFKKNRYVFRLIDDKFNLKDEEKLINKKNALDKTINSSLHSVADKIGLDFPLTMHTARHSFAVQAINNGIDIKILSKLMGHATIATTEKVYAKVLLPTICKEYNVKTDFYNKTESLTL